MAVVDDVGERRILSRKDVRNIIRGIAPSISALDLDLSQNLPFLVDYVSDLAKRRTNNYVLSDFYPGELPTYEGEKTIFYEVYYRVDKDGLQLCAFDPTSDAMDPGESYMKQIPAQEFLGWVMDNRARMIDVYQHIQAALKQKKGNGEAHRRHFEAYL